MLLQSREMAESLYNPINHLTQSELMEKFNLAFYEAQNLSKTDILSTFDEPVHRTDVEKNSDDYLIEFLLPKALDSPASTPDSLDVDVNFDFNDFDLDFYQNFGKQESQNSPPTEHFDTETFTTESSYENFDPNVHRNFSNFFVPPPFGANKHEDRTSTPEEMLNFEDIDVCEELSNGSLDIDNLPEDLQELEKSACEFVEGLRDNFLPPVGTITKNNMDFNNFLRTGPVDNMHCYEQESIIKQEFGHLIGVKCPNDNLVPDINRTQEEISAQQYFESNEENHMVLSQSDALLNDDPLLSSSNLMYPKSRSEYVCSDYDSEYTNDCDEVSSSTSYQCKWEECYQVYESQHTLVKHIEKTHVELKRGDEFTCFWENCPRKTKPFNARYKLLIHMRVHSGEKPNKCPFKGCSKAFSRLENLKIHQRSHTGERPYLCQFSNCAKSFSNSSDRAKHQRTHFDTKPYACQVVGCSKKYTDPSSLRKHVKNHTYEEQMQVKRKSCEDGSSFITPILAKKFLDPMKQKAIKSEPKFYDSSYEHSYSSSIFTDRKCDSVNVRQDLKNKLKLKKLLC